MIIIEYFTLTRHDQQTEIESKTNNSQKQRV